VLQVVQFPSLSQVQVELLKVKYYPNSLLFLVLQVCGSIIIPSTSRIVEVKVSQQFTFFCRFSCTSLSQLQVELFESKSIPTVHFGAAGCDFHPSLSSTGIVESKSIQQFCLFFLVQVVQFPSLSHVTSRIVEVKVSQQFTFVGSLV
jgi:hypothetical protein